VALLRDPKYVESMLARDSCCLQGAVVSSFSCICGFWGHVFMCIFGLIGFGYWVYKIVVDSNSNKSNDLDFVVNILTALGFFFFSLYTIYATAVNQTKILALLLSEFQRKLDVLDLINGRLEMTQVRLKRTQEALDMTQENFTQTHQEYVRVKDELNDSNGYLRETQMKMQDTENKLEAQVLEFGELLKKEHDLSKKNQELMERHENLNASYNKLLREYDAAIVKQQTLMSETFQAVANMHRDSNSQISELLDKLSSHQGKSKEIAAEFGKKFLGMDKLREELHTLRSSLENSLNKLENTTDKNIELSNKLKLISEILPELVQQRDKVREETQNHRKQTSVFFELLQSTHRKITSLSNDFSKPLDHRNTVNLTLDIGSTPPRTPTTRPYEHTMAVLNTTL